MTDSGLRLRAVEDIEGQKESFLCPDLAIPLAAAALEAVRAQHDLAAKQRIIGDAPALSSPLEGSHPFHWSVAATLRREMLRGVERGLGHDSSPGRRLVLQGKHPTPGRAVVASVSEIAEHEEAFISHLRRL